MKYTSTGSSAFPHTIKNIAQKLHFGVLDNFQVPNYGGGGGALVKCNFRGWSGNDGTFSRMEILPNVKSSVERGGGNSQPILAYVQAEFGTFSQMWRHQEGWGELTKSDFCIGMYVRAGRKDMKHANRKIVIIDVLASSCGGSLRRLCIALLFIVHYWTGEGKMSLWRATT